jgi:O-antigen/teichoic acid export membrane protein
MIVKKIINNLEFRWTILYQLSVLVGGALLIKLLAVSLTKGQYGSYALITSIVAFVLMMPFTPLLQGISRNISVYNSKNKKDLFFLNMFFVWVFLVAFYLFLSFLLYFYLPNSWRGLYFFVVFYIISEIFKVFLYTVSNANRLRKEQAVASFIEISIKLGGIYIVHSYSDFSLSLSFLILLLTIANLISILILKIKHSSNNLAFLYNKEFKVQFLRVWLFSYPFIIWGVFGWLRDMSNRWYLDYFMDKEQVALFAMMATIALVIPSALQGIIGSYFIPILYQKENSQPGCVRNFLKIMLPSMLIIILVIFSLFFFNNNLIVSIFADSKYLEIAWMLPWMFLAYGFYVLSMMSSYELLAHKKTKKLIVSSIVPGFFSLVFGYFLIKEYGINGALLNYLITYGSYSVFTFIVVFKYWKENDSC